MRQVALDDKYSHFGVTRLIADNRAFYSNKGIMFLAPLYLARDNDQDLLADAEAERGTNLDPLVASSTAQLLGLAYTNQPTGDFTKTLGAEDIFHYAYGVFHSPAYRSRYAEFLKIDFPRLPLTDSLDLFRALAKLGGELVALHLLESPRLDQPLTEFIGSNHEVSKVGYSDGTVWIDASGTRGNVTAGTSGFRGVPTAVWNFHIGGYQVCEKWLKDRKGRKLSLEGIRHYHRIVVALSETIRLMAEIDRVIDEHGGWPGAFQAA